MHARDGIQHRQHGRLCPARRRPQQFSAARLPRARDLSMSLGVSEGRRVGIRAEAAHAPVKHSSGHKPTPARASERGE
eukprot:1976658-Rhodomonas_salina.1